MEHELGAPCAETSMLNIILFGYVLPMLLIGAAVSFVVCAIIIFYASWWSV